MREVRDTKGKVVYRIENNRIIPEGPKDMRKMHKTLRERKIMVVNSKRNTLL